ncbi:small multi-drug export protein [Candidatus Falkowbacteria bacterium]|nr:small multi-drug export protein [Candidatus Falkowbacteria bacterium]
MFGINYAEIFKNFPPEAATALVAMIPIAELRVALPVALLVYGMSFWSAFLWSVLGNMVPIFFIVYLIKPVVDFLMKHWGLARRFFNWWFNRVRRKFEDGILKYGINLALVIFVAIPLPLTGAWSGAVAAFLFGIPPRRALILIAIGVIIAGIIVGLITGGGLYLFK